MRPFRASTRKQRLHTGWDSPRAVEHLERRAHNHSKLIRDRHHIGDTTDHRKNRELTE
jgi:hypothetical protein